VFFRADSLPHALQYLGAMADVSAPSGQDLQLAILLNAEVIAALVIGSVLSVPAMPRIMALLKRPMAEQDDGLGPLDTRRVHAYPVLLLALGFVLSVSILVGSTLNPFLYFRF